ncbi:MAG: hypothetical protein HPY59_04530 [Anaerolineae bacterium]|nr:hypothetical protein [Anaerolineae bacterium]
MKRLSFLQTGLSRGAAINEVDPGRWRLSLPSGPAGEYRWAQLDDYRDLARSKFGWQPPARLAARLRVSDGALPGTWGFGLWNDPFSFNMGLGGMTRRLPVLPNAAWFFYASPPNYLALRDNHPAQGLLAATFSSPCIPSWMLAPLGLSLPLLLIPATARLLRWAARSLVNEEAILASVDATEWHDYWIEWLAERVSFWVDGRLLLETGISPRGRLGLVIWLDNQYLSFPPGGRLRAGTLAYEAEAWLEIEEQLPD